VTGGSTTSSAAPPGLRHAAARQLANILSGMAPDFRSRLRRTPTGAHPSGPKGARVAGRSGARPAPRTKGRFQRGVKRRLKGDRTKEAGPGRVKQFRAAFSMTRKNDPKLVPYMLGAFTLGLAISLGLGLLTGHLIYATVMGVLIGLSAATLIFGRRAQASAFASVEGQPGAAAAVLQSMRGDWRVNPAVGFNRHQDLVHRVIGRPGVVVVGEGVPGRAAGLVAQERRRVARVVGDVPIYDVLVGDSEGQVPLRKLQTHCMKLPRNLKPAQVNAVEARLRALGGTNVPMPKGPLPKGAKMPRGVRPR
jgi:Domain of unknown function (DUF4191)